MFSIASAQGRDGSLFNEFLGDKSLAARKHSPRALSDANVSKDMNPGMRLHELTGHLPRSYRHRVAQCDRPTPLWIRAILTYLDVIGIATGPVKAQHASRRNARDR